MSRSTLLYMAWCLLLLGFTAWAGWNAWDPFADGGGHHSGPPDRTHHHGGYGGCWGFGPSHK
jgi:hypothetical protein